MTTETLPPSAAGSTAAGPTGPGGGRTVLRLLGVLFAVLAVGFGALNIIGSLAREKVRHTATYEGVRAVDVEMDEGTVEVTGGAGETVSVDRTIAWSLRKPEVEERVDGDRLVIRVHCSFDLGRGCGGSLRLQVPSRTDLAISGSDGSVSLRGIAGTVDASASDGAIRLRDVTGPVRLRTSDGSIEALGLTSDSVEAITSDGSVRLVFAVAPGSVSARSSDGGVEILVPRGEQAYHVDAETSDGSREIDVRTDSASERVIEVRTSDGSVRVAYAD